MDWKGLKSYFRGAEEGGAAAGESNKKTANSWITRLDGGTFRVNSNYFGVVESVQSRRAATIIVAQKKNGQTLMWDDDWNSKNVEFARVLLLVDRLRTSDNGPQYGKDVVMFDVLHEGEAVVVDIRNASLSPDNIYRYFAHSGYKIDGLAKKSERVMTRISDPLRGIVDCLVSTDAGVIRFGTYDGRIAKCLFTIDNLYFKGEKMKKHLPLGSVTSVDTEVFLEITKWNNHDVKQEWEKMLYKEGIIFRSSLVWLRCDPRPSRSGVVEKQQKFKTSNHNTQQTNATAGNNPGRSTSSPFGQNPVTGYHLSNVKAYCGIVETFTSFTSAVVCTAHRNGEPITWTDNWFDRDVYLERILLLAEHVRLSKNESQCPKGTRIDQILRIGEPLSILVQKTEKSSERCYKWFAKTCWKEEGVRHMIPVNSLPGQLHGEIETLISHSIGIIKFQTYHGLPAKAFFTHENIYKDGEKIMKHLPLALEVNAGTQVYIVVNKWNPVSNLNESDREMIQKGVCFRATLVWTKGSPKPIEDGSYNFKKAEGKSDSWNQSQKHGIQKGGQSEKHSYPNQHQQHDSGRAKQKENVKREGKNFSQGRGERQVTRGHGRGGHRRQQHGGLGRDESDSHSICTEGSESNMSDLSSLSDYFLGMNFSQEETLKDFHPDKESAMKHSHKNRQETRGPKPYKNEPFGTKNMTIFSEPDLSQLSSDFPPILLNKGLTGTLVSVDESWGLVKVDEDEVYNFLSSVVYLYGLKLDNIPLQKLFRQGQTVTVHLKGERVSLLEYGAPQLPNQMRQAVITYCEMNSIPHNVRDMLESTMLRYGI